MWFVTSKLKISAKLYRHKFQYPLFYLKRNLLLPFSKNFNFITVLDMKLDGKTTSKMQLHVSMNFNAYIYNADMHVLSLWKRSGVKVTGKRVKSEPPWMSFQTRLATQSSVRTFLHYAAILAGVPEKSRKGTHSCFKFPFHFPHLEPHRA